GALHLSLRPRRGDAGALLRAGGDRGRAPARGGGDARVRRVACSGHRGAAHRVPRHGGGGGDPGRAGRRRDRAAPRAPRVRARPAAERGAVDRRPARRHRVAFPQRLAFLAQAAAGLARGDSQGIHIEGAEPYGTAPRCCINIQHDRGPPGLMEIAAILLLGLAVGTAAGWFFRSLRARSEIEISRLESGPDLALMEQRAEQAEGLLRDAQARLQQVDKERVAALEDLRVESSRRASFEAVSQRVPDLEQTLQYREQTLVRQQQTILETTREKESLAATMQAERRGFDEKLRLLDEAKSALSDAFRALSAGALKSNSEEFLRLAQAALGKFQEGAKSDLAMREQAIVQLVSPVRDALQRFETKVQALEVAREGAYQGLVQQVNQLLDTGKELRSETSNLVQALRAPVTRGQWGEIQLRRVIEMAGMLNYCDFVEQEKVVSEDGMLRPDVVVKLPAGKTIIIDAKAPVTSYIDAVSLDDENERKVKLQGFAKLVRDHVS